MREPDPAKVASVAHQSGADEGGNTYGKMLIFQ
jgi:hypothetical protein